MEFYDLRSVEVTEEIPEDIDAYGYLQGIYQGRWPYDSHRVRAARECLPFERPRLAVIGHVGDNGSFADRLERALERSSKVLELRKVEELAPPTRMRRL